MKSEGNGDGRKERRGERGRERERKECRERKQTGVQNVHNMNPSFMSFTLYACTCIVTSMYITTCICMKHKSNLCSESEVCQLPSVGHIHSLPRTLAECFLDFTHHL